MHGASTGVLGESTFRATRRGRSDDRLLGRPWATTRARSPIELEAGITEPT
jgi:hypothetical protein